jgi:hypothetical protein
MFVTAVSIRREGYYGSYGGGKADPAKPFHATIEVHGQHGKVELNVSPDLSARIIEVVADEIAAAGKATADAMTASFINAQPALASKAA